MYHRMYFGKDFDINISTFNSTYLSTQSIISTQNHKATHQNLNVQSEKLMKAFYNTLKYTCGCWYIIHTEYRTPSCSTYITCVLIHIEYTVTVHTCILIHTEYTAVTRTCIPVMQLLFNQSSSKWERDDSPCMCVIRFPYIYNLDSFLKLDRPLIFYENPVK